MSQHVGTPRHRRYLGNSSQNLAIGLVRYSSDPLNESDDNNNSQQPCHRGTKRRDLRGK
jgi:hypothetical protein